MNRFLKMAMAACAAAAVMLTAGTTLQAAEVQTFPCSTTEEFIALFQKQVEEAPESIYFHPYTGFFVEDVVKEEMQGERKLFTYIADETRHCASSVFVAVPSGEEAVAFLTDTGWVALADEYKFILHAMVPEGDAWGEEDNELMYMGAAFGLGSKTINYSPYTGNYYFVGYGDGGRLLEEYLMSTPDNAAGMVILDGSSISADYLAKMAETPAIAVNKTVDKVNVPVWIVEKEFSAEAQAVVDYWKAADCVEETAYGVTYVSYPTEVYFENPVSNQAQVNDYALSKVQVTEAEVNYKDADFSRAMWTGFLKKVGRYNSLQGKDLRPEFDMEALGITREERTIDGYYRYWLEYVPAAVKASGKAAPLVLAFHGAGQCGEAYAPYSEWFKVADEAGLIVVFPTAYPYAENNGMARPIHNDCWGTDRPDDLSYWRQLIADVQSRWNVDATRIYSTGHSNGGNTSAMIAGEMSDIIAAVGISAGRYRNALNKVTEDVSTLHPMASTNEMPVIQLVGTNDGGAYRSATMVSTMQYWLERDAVDLENVERFSNGTYHSQLWYNADGVPMVRYTVIENKPHTTTPSESRLLWNEWLCHYQRGEDGSVIYNGDDSFTIENWEMVTAE